MSRTRHHGKNQKKRQFGDEWRWMDSWPKEWDTQFHIRPRRRKDKQKCKKVLKQVDNGDSELFELDKKPHYYYW